MSPSTGLTVDIFKTSQNMLFSALLADYAIKVLFVSVEKLQVERARYPTLGRRTMGSFGEYLSSLVVTLQQCGACIGYMVIIHMAFPVI